MEAVTIKLYMTRSVEVPKVFWPVLGWEGSRAVPLSADESDLHWSGAAGIPSSSLPPGSGRDSAEAGTPFPHFSELPALTAGDSCPDHPPGPRGVQAAPGRAERWEEPGWERLSRGLRFPPCVLPENCTDGEGSASAGGAAQPVPGTQPGSESLENTFQGLFCLWQPPWVSPEEGRCDGAEIRRVP